MTYEELVRDTKELVKDASPTILVAIPDYVNEAYQWVTGEIAIPSLKSFFTVTTVLSQAYTTISGSFSGKLTYVGDSDGPIKICDGGLEELLRYYPNLDEAGDVTHVALEGTILWYNPIPSTAETLNCVGYTLPADMSSDSDTPSHIPSYLHREILCHKAAAIAYSIIEDGIEGDKVNTLRHEQLSEEGMIKLKKWLSQRRNNIKTSIWDV